MLFYYLIRCFWQKYELCIELCINMLLENGYPLDFIFNVINRRLKRNYSYIRLMYGIREKKIQLIKKIL